MMRAHRPILEVPYRRGWLWPLLRYIACLLVLLAILAE